MRCFLALAAVFVAPACATYSSARLDRLGVASKPAEVFGDVEARQFGKRVQVKLPSELVIAEVVANTTWERDGRQDKRSVQLAQALAEEKSTFSNVEPLFVDSWSAKYEDLRATASRHHADLMVVASMTERVHDESSTALEALNLLIVPCFVVPTKAEDISLHVRVAVVDVRNDLVYATFEDHGEERVHATSAGEADAVQEGFDRLYAASLSKMRGRVAERLRTLERAD